MPSASRKAAKLSLDSELLAQARELEENAEAIRAHNEYFARHGLALEKYRMF